MSPSSLRLTLRCLVNAATETRPAKDTGKGLVLHIMASSVHIIHGEWVGNPFWGVSKNRQKSIAKFLHVPTYFFSGY